MITGFSELTLQAQDPDALARFYREAFGLPELSRGEDRVWLRVGNGARLGLWKPGAKEFGDRGGAHVHFAFAVEPAALDALADRLRASGIEVRGPLQHEGGDRSLYVRDPEGNVVEAWDLGQRPHEDIDDTADAPGSRSARAALED
jgi:catechol-2,3-dioxygenase